MVASALQEIAYFDEVGFGVRWTTRAASRAHASPDESCGWRVWQVVPDVRVEEYPC